ncbi:MAG: SpoIIE family protein phosphatase, partial [Proteobacteria bacterium]|nr:SpoIIE family protein phosphatase [Pseudomonadota bacterium]
MLDLNKQQTVLVVDDTPENITLMSEILGDHYQIKVALNGRKALSIAQSDKPPDIILLDIMMPEMDGYEVCKILKENESMQAIPVIFVTAMSDIDDEQQGLSLGAVDYITKPVSPPLLLARVKTQLRLYNQNRYLDDLVQQRTRQLSIETAHRQKLENELQVARDIQMAMLPRQVDGGITVGRCRISAQLRPAREVGGDFYCIFPVANNPRGNNKVIFAIGDVSGKSVPAALFMARACTLLESTGNDEHSPEKIMLKMNQALCRNNDECMFVTVGCGVLDTQTGELNYASAGHDSPVLIQQNGSVSVLEVSGGPLIGIYESAEFALSTTQLQPGESLLLYTDGIT